MRSDRRLHPLSFLFVVGGELGSLLFPGLLVLLAVRRGGGWETWAMWLAIPFSLYAVVRHLLIRYSYAEEELIVRSGLLSRTERHIRYARVQNVEIVRNPLHRLLSVAEVRVETGGGKECEARLRVLPVAAAEEMRSRVFEGRRRPATLAEAASASLPEAAPAQSEAVAAADPRECEVVGAKSSEAAPTPASREVLRLSARELAIFGLFENRGMLVISAVLGVLWEAGVFGMTGLPRLRLGEKLWQAIRDAGGIGTVWRPEMALALVGIVLGFLIVVRLLSVAWAMVQLHGFTLTRTVTELRTACGLFTRVVGLIPAHRVQLLTVIETPLLRLFGRVAVRVETAGGEADAAASRHWLAPVLPRERLATLLDEVAPDYALGSVEWSPVHPDARRRLLRESLWVVLIASLALAPFARLWTGAVILLLVPLAVVVSRRQAAAMSWTLTPEIVAFRGGWLWRHTSVARHSRIQAVTLDHSPFDRRWGMATVTADTAGGGSHPIRIEYLDAGVATGLFAQLGARASSTAFAW